MELCHLDRVDYLPTYEAMQAFTAARTPETPDELWICEHDPVYTQGLAGKAEHTITFCGICCHRNTMCSIPVGIEWNGTE